MGNFISGPDPGNRYINAPGLGVIVLMFLAGLKTYVGDFKKAGFPATLTAVGGVMLPMAVRTLYAMAAGYTGFVPLFVGTHLV